MSLASSLGSPAAKGRPCFRPELSACSCPADPRCSAKPGVNVIHNHYFRRFLSIFVKIIGAFYKNNNVVIQFLDNLALVWVENAIFGRKYKRITISVSDFFLFKLCVDSIRLYLDGHKRDKCWTIFHLADEFSSIKITNYWRDSLLLVARSIPAGVTRLGEFSPLWRILARKSYINLDKNGLG
jgi:hypothetical protein